MSKRTARKAYNATLPFGVTPEEEIQEDTCEACGIMTRGYSPVECVSVSHTSDESVVVFHHAAGVDLTIRAMPDAVTPRLLAFKPGIIYHLAFVEEP